MTVLWRKILALPAWTWGVIAAAGIALLGIFAKRRRAAHKAASIVIASYETEKLADAQAVERIAELDAKILATKREAVEAIEKTKGLTDEQVSDRFRSLGF